MRFHWIKQFISNKYPALQIEQRAGNLRGALERGIRFGKVELVKSLALFILKQKVEQHILWFFFFKMHNFEGNVRLIKIKILTFLDNFFSSGVVVCLLWFCYFF